MIKSNIFLKLSLAIIIFLNTGCIHLRTGESIKVELTEENGISKQSTESYELRSMVYSEDKYPLEDFLKKLGRGDFENSLKNINLNYKPANTDNIIFKKLISNGYTPAYFSYQNKTNTDIKINYKQFALTDGQNSVAPLSPIVIPKKIEKFNTKALAANTYNVTITVTGVVLLVLMLAYLQVPNLNLHGVDYTQDDYKVLNPLDYTTRIDYQNFLLFERTIKPNESISGLIFFEKRKTDNFNKSRLVLLPTESVLN